MDSKGPPFFLQECFGKGMSRLRLIKFRTMKVKKDASKGRFDPGDVKRVTRPGFSDEASKNTGMRKLFCLGRLIQKALRPLEKVVSLGPQHVVY